MLGALRIEEWGLSVSASEFCAGAPFENPAQLIDRLFRLYAEREGKRRWGDKTPQHAFFINDIKSVFPEARFIHLIRDGRDVAESYKRVFIGPQSIYGAAKRWKNYVNALDDAKNDLDAEHYLEIRFEDLVSNPDKQLAKILAFLDEEYAPTGDGEMESHARKRYLNIGSHHGSLAKPISKAKIGVFKSAFNTREVQIFESIAGDELSSHGYSLQTNGDARISISEHAKFFVQDQVLRYARKFKSANGRKQLGRDLIQARQKTARKLGHLWLRLSPGR